MSFLCFRIVWPKVTNTMKRQLFGGFARSVITLVLFAILVWRPPPTRANDGSVESSAKQAIERGLNFLARDAVAWKAEHDCSSCHHAALVVWAMNEARVRGHVVDEVVLKDLTRWLTEAGEGRTSVERPAAAPRALNSKAIYYGLGLGSIPNPNSSEREALGRFLATVKSDQIENGSWVAWPETRPPMFGPSDQSMTTLATLALLSGEAIGDSSAKAKVDQGFKWLSETNLDDETQSLVLRLLLWARLGRPNQELSPLIEQIQGRQNSDGGWSQVPNGASDAWATGQALYALSHGHVSPTNTMVIRGRGFLKRTQSAEGSWAMKSRPTKPGDSGAKNLMPITGAGTAWAVLGLLRSEPR